MRSTKVLAFSVPPELERQMQAHARAEHRTLSEYIREAVRQYMTAKDFQAARKSASTKVKRKGLSVKDVEQELEKVRSRSK